jgi:hypothetical protein
MTPLETVVTPLTPPFVGERERDPDNGRRVNAAGSNPAALSAVAPSKGTLCRVIPWLLLNRISLARHSATYDESPKNRAITSVVGLDRRRVVAYFASCN